MSLSGDAILPDPFEVPFSGTCAEPPGGAGAHCAHLTGQRLGIHGEIGLLQLRIAGLPAAPAEAHNIGQG